MSEELYSTKGNVLAIFENQTIINSNLARTRTTKLEGSISKIYFRVWMSMIKNRTPELRNFYPELRVVEMFRKCSGKCLLSKDQNQLTLQEC